MSIPGKVLIAVLVAFAVAGIAAALDPGYTLSRALPIAAAAAVLSVVLSHRALRMPAALSAGASGQSQRAQRAPAGMPTDTPAEARGRPLKKRPPHRSAARRSQPVAQRPSRPKTPGERASSRAR